MVVQDTHGVHRTTQQYSIMIYSTQIIEKVAAITEKYLKYSYIYSVYKMY